MVLGSGVVLPIGGEVMTPHVRTKGLRKVRWGFDAIDGPIFIGYTDDSRWNGWLNIWVTPTVHKSVIRVMEKEEREQPGSAEDTLAEMRAMVPDDIRGLISYAHGYTTEEIPASVWRVRSRRRGKD